MDHDVRTTNYDAVGNLRELTDPAGNVTEFSYDATYRKTGDATLARLALLGSPQLVTRAYQYDKQNNRLTSFIPFQRGTGRPKGRPKGQA